MKPGSPGFRPSLGSTWGGRTSGPAWSTWTAACSPGWKDPIEAARGPEAGLRRIAALVEQAIQKAGPVRLGGIGIGASGPVDRALGAIQNPHTLPTWENVDVVTPLSARFGVPVALENDADIAILGEYWTGAGRDCARLAMITVGTGIGVSLMADGRLYRGAGGYHPEGGHIVLDPHGPLCYCGARGCWESLASGTAIARLAREREAAHPTSLLERAGGDLEQIDADLVGQAAEEGDVSAREVIDQAAFYLGLGLVNVIGLFFPEVIVLGGGVMRRYALMQPVVEQTLARHAVMVRAPDARIELARLGVQAGVVGAAYAVLQELE